MRQNNVGGPRSRSLLTVNPIMGHGELLTKYKLITGTSISYVSLCSDRSGLTYIIFIYHKMWKITRSVV